VRGPSLIIDKWSTRPAWARCRDWLLSALMWLAYLYLLRVAIVDLYHLMVDSFEWLFASGGRPHATAISQFLGTLEIYGIVILADGAILITWALYNWRRYGRSDRHRDHDPVSVDDLALLYELPAEDIARWQRSRILVMQHNLDGTLDRVISKDRDLIPTPLLQTFAAEPAQHSA
jgi:biofilm PGA synthesis protein PgaD